MTPLSPPTLVIPRFVFYVRSDLIPDVGITEDQFRRPTGVKSLLVEREVHILGHEFVQGGDKVLKPAAKAVYGPRVDYI